MHSERVFHENVQMHSRLVLSPHSDVRHDMECNENVRQRRRFSSSIHRWLRKNEARWKHECKCWSLLERGFPRRGRFSVSSRVYLIWATVRKGTLLSTSIYVQFYFPVCNGKKLCSALWHNQVYFAHTKKGESKISSHARQHFSTWLILKSKIKLLFFFVFIFVRCCCCWCFSCRQYFFPLFMKIFGVFIKSLFRSTHDFVSPHDLFRWSPKQISHKFQIAHKFLVSSAEIRDWLKGFITLRICKAFCSFSHKIALKMHQLLYYIAKQWNY